MSYKFLDFFLFLSVFPPILKYYDWFMVHVQSCMLVVTNLSWIYVGLSVFFPLFLPYLF